MCDSAIWCFEECEQQLCTFKSAVSTCIYNDVYKYIHSWNNNEHSITSKLTVTNSMKYAHLFYLIIKDIRQKRVRKCGCDCNVHCFTIRFRCEKHYMRTLMTDKHMNHVLIPGGSLRKYLAHSLILNKYMVNKN